MKHHFKEFLLDERNAKWVREVARYLTEPKKNGLIISQLTSEFNNWYHHKMCRLHSNIARKRVARAHVNKFQIRKWVEGRDMK